MAEQIGGERTTLKSIAAGAGPVLVDRSWIHRRVHKVRFTSAGMVRHSISIDFSIPANLSPYERLEGGRAVYFVPVLALRKWPPLMQLDLRDDGGNPLPLLTTRKNEQVDGEALAGMAPSGLIADAVREILRKLPEQDRDQAAKQLNAVAMVVQAAPSTLIPDGQRRRWGATLSTALSLVSNQIFWARIEGRAEERRIVKIAYEHPLQQDRALSRRVFAGLSWAPLRLQFTVQDIGHGTSYHVEVEPPPDLEIHRARLELVDRLDAAGSDLGQDARGPRGPRNIWWALRNTLAVRSALFIGRGTPRPADQEERRPASGEAWTMEHDDRAYLYVNGERRRTALGLVRVDLATSRRGLRPSAAMVGVATTAFLVAMAMFAPHAASDSEASIATLLIAPAVLTYLLVPTGEHPLVRSRLAGVRVLLAALASLPILAALTLLSFGEHPDGGTVQWCWFGLAGISLALTALLGLSWLLPPIKDRRQDYRRPASR